jgi:hypothetical protein
MLFYVVGVPNGQTPQAMSDCRYIALPLLIKGIVA